MEDLQLNVEDAENPAESRRRTRVADPLPEGSTAWRRERERERKSQVSFRLTPRSMTLDDLELLKVKFSPNFARLRFWEATTAKRMKIDQYCQRQRCKHVEFEQFLARFRVVRVWTHTWTKWHELNQIIFIQSLSGGQLQVLLKFVNYEYRWWAVSIQVAV